ncbi:MAG: pyridoxal phosphate-dependent aminotransferase [Devosia sp.]
MPALPPQHDLHDGHFDYGLTPFHAMEILALARQLEGQGRSICHLEVGEPGVPPAPEVREAAVRALALPQRYTHAKGMPELRARLARWYRERHGAEVDPEHILVTMGSSAGFILAFLSAFATGARIAVTRPGYPAYLNTIAALGFSAREIALSPETGWRLDAGMIEAAFRAEPFEGLLFASPANPTGAMISPEGMAEVVETCRRLGVRLISDEIYHGLSYGMRCASALETTDAAIIVNSFSKYFCMTGWRIGWLVLPEALVRRAEMLQQNLFISAPSLSQIAGLAALETTAYSELQREGYGRNRGLLTEGLARLGFGVGAPSDGAFYAYADASAFTNQSLEFCKAMLAEAGVAATPGVDFDRRDGGRYVRFSYAGTEETMTEALERLGCWLGR